MRFRVLGPLEVVDRERSTPIRANREGALLAILLVNAGKLVSTPVDVGGDWSA